MRPGAEPFLNEMAAVLPHSALPHQRHLSGHLTFLFATGCERVRQCIEFERPSLVWKQGQRLPEKGLCNFRTPMMFVMSGFGSFARRIFACLQRWNASRFGVSFL